NGEAEEAVYAHGLGADTVRTTTVTDFDYGIDLDGDTSYVAGNTLLRTRESAIYLYGPVARVESNTIQHARFYGIQANNVDSVVVRGNLIEDVTDPGC